MQKPSVVAQDISIVFLGDLNPRIFQPAWFAATGLIRTSEAENAAIQLLHKDVSNFSTDWFNVQVLSDRFTIRTSQEPYSKHLYDLVLGTFKILRHTPLRQMGINRAVTYQFQDENDWHALGHLLTPKTIWNKFLKMPGMRSLTMQGRREDEDKVKGAIFVTIESSMSIQRGADFKVNDHYEVNDASKVVGCEELIAILESTFFESQKRSLTIIDGVLNEL